MRTQPSQQHGHAHAITLRVFVSVSFLVSACTIGTTACLRQAVDFAVVRHAGAFMCLFMSYGIGANDVANSFATSVGSRTLTLFQACVLAAICEVRCVATDMRCLRHLLSTNHLFACKQGTLVLALSRRLSRADLCSGGARMVQFGGAVLLGRGVSSTIKSGIVDVDYFTDAPEIVMYGMLCALFSAGAWLLIVRDLSLSLSLLCAAVSLAFHQLPWRCAQAQHKLRASPRPLQQHCMCARASA